MNLVCYWVEGGYCCFSRLTAYSQRHLVGSRGAQALQALMTKARLLLEAASTILILQDLLGSQSSGIRDFKEGRGSSLGVGHCFLRAFAALWPPYS